MEKSPRAFEIYSAFLGHFLEEGIEKIPYHSIKFDKAFYYVLQEHPDLVPYWKLLRRDNPQVRKLTDLDCAFQLMGVTSYNHSNFPESITLDVDKERFTELGFCPTEAEEDIAKKVHDLYNELLLN